MGDDNLTFEIRDGGKKVGDPDIRRMQALVEAVNVKNGWFDKDRTFGDDMALLHSEVSEAFEAFRKHGLEDVTGSLCTIDTVGHSHYQDGTSLQTHTCKPEGVGSELADVLVRLLDTCERYDIDIVAEFWRKLQYNHTRSYRHGNRRV